MNFSWNLKIFWTFSAFFHSSWRFCRHHRCVNVKPTCSRVQGKTWESHEENVFRLSCHFPPSWCCRCSFCRRSRRRLSCTMSHEVTSESHRKFQFEHFPETFLLVKFQSFFLPYSLIKFCTPQAFFTSTSTFHKLGKHFSVVSWKVLQNEFWYYVKSENWGFCRISFLCIEQVSCWNSKNFCCLTKYPINFPFSESSAGYLILRNFIIDRVRENIELQLWYFRFQFHRHH